MDIIELIRNKISGVDPDTLNAYRSAIPHTVNLNIRLKGDSFIATINSVDNKSLPKEVLLVTEAETQEKLVDMVNDLVFTYKNIPEKYRPFYKKILKPEGEVSRNESLNLVKAA